MWSRIKDALKWVGTDGLLHFLVCYAIVLAFTPIIGLWYTLAIAVITSLGKEGYDFFIQKDNDKKQVIHDLICDAAGIILAIATIGVWWIIIR